MFASYEMNKTIEAGDFNEFETAVEQAKIAQDAAWDLGFDSGTGPTSSDVYRIHLRESLYEAIKESSVYLVRGNAAEKEQALAAFSNFDETLATAEEQYPDESYDDLKQIKADLMQSAEKIFDTYETEGAVDAGQFADLKNRIETLYTGF
jgi:hypothetical protein